MERKMERMERKTRKIFYISGNIGHFGRPKEALRKNNLKKKKQEKVEFHRVIDFCVQNCNSVHSERKDKLTKLGIKDSKADVIVLTETKLGEGSNDFQVPGYKIVAQRDRKRGAGGIMILAKTGLIITDAEAGDVVEEIQVATFKINSLMVIGVYRSPTIIFPTTDREHHGRLIKYLDNKIDSHKGPYVVTGDFNLGYLAKYNFRPPNLPEQRDGEEPTYHQAWQQWFSLHDLQQHVDVPTFAASDSRLDLCMTPNGQDVSTLQVSNSIFGPSFDHHTLLFSIPMEFETTEIPRYRRVQTPETWKKYRASLLKLNIAKNVTNLVQQQYPTGGYENKEDCVNDYFMKEVTDAYEKATPEVLVKTPPIEGYLSQGTVQLIRRSKNRYGALKKGKDSGLWSEEKIAKVKQEIKIMQKAIRFQMKRDRKNNEMRTLENSLKKNDGFYKLMNRITKKPKSSNNAVRDEEGNLQTKPADIANTFNDYLGKTLEGGEKVDIVWTEIAWAQTKKGLKKGYFERFVKPSVDPEGPRVDGKLEILEQVWITPEAVANEIKKAKKDAQGGPDGLPMNVFAEAVDILSEPLAMLYNMVNQSGNVPKAWKITRVVMLHKKKSQDDVKNYRPLSMSDHVGKIWERLINSALKAHLEKHGLLDPHQHGFRGNMGTQTNLLEMWEEIINRLEKDGSLVELWSYDLTKAFDLLDHNKVLHLLKKAGVTGSIGIVIQNWLCGRTQYVQNEGAKSRQVPVNKSCVQGSCLGPTLWLVYIQSLLNRLKANGAVYYGYADDIAIVKTIKTDEDKEKFEITLKILEDWAIEYGMSWSPLKTQRLVMKYKGCVEPRPPHEIKFLGEIIEPLECKAESLGLLISKNCIFGDHIKRIADRIKAISCKIRRNIISRDPDIMQKVYNGWAQSRIDYVSVVYNPSTEALLAPITKSANSFWKLCSSGKPHEKFIEPRVRLIINDLIMFHNISTGRSPLDFKSIFKTTSPTDPEMILKNVRFRNKKIVIPKLRLQLSRLSFSFRVRPYWNLLPNEFKTMKQQKFKSEVKDYILKNKQKFLNIGLRDYNIVGETAVKEVRKKKNSLPLRSGRKYKKWTVQLKNPIKTRAKKKEKKKVNQSTPKPATNDWIWDWDKLKRLK